MPRTLIALFLTILFSPTTAQTLKGTYTLSSVATDKNLDGNEKDVYPHDPNGGDHQKWTLKQTGTVKERKVYALTNLATGLRLDGDGDRLYTHAPNDGQNQLWIIDPADCANCFTLTNLATNKRLDGNAEHLYPFEQNEGNFQKWRILKVVATAAAPPTPTARLEAPAATTVRHTPGATQSIYRKSDWSPWNHANFGVDYRYHWRINSMDATHPKFLEVVAELKNTAKEGIWEGTVRAYKCNTGQLSDKYFKRVEIKAGATETIIFTALNCGTGEKPNIKVYASKSQRID